MEVTNLLLSFYVIVLLDALLGFSGQASDSSQGTEVLQGLLPPGSMALLGLEAVQC